MAQGQSPAAADMPSQWQEFIETKLDSFVKWDLIRFFHDNPHIQDTAESIAKSVARDKATTARHLNGLVEADVLSVTQRGSACIYQLTDSAETRAMVRDFMDACLDRDFRAQAIHYLIHNVRSKPS